MSISLENVSEIRSSFAYIKGAMGSQIGGRNENQDCVACFNTPHGFLVTVCDGMGGGPGGATASTIAVETIHQSIAEASAEEARINIVIKAIRMANEAIIARGKEEPMLSGMGSTCTVLLINAESAIVAHVGDSRIYQLRGHKKIWRTFDHSMVFDLVKRGVITEEQARCSAQSNIINRALGIKLDVEVEAQEIPFERGDRFVLTTDGIHGAMPEKVLLKYLTDHDRDTVTLVEVLSRKIEDIGILSGGHHDNNTIAIVDVNKDSKLKPKMSRLLRQIFTGVLIILAASLILNGILWYRSDKTATTDASSAVLVDSIKGLTDSIKERDKTIKGLETRLQMMQQSNENGDQRIEALTKIITRKDSCNKAYSDAIKAVRKAIENFKLGSKTEKDKKNAEANRQTALKKLDELLKAMEQQAKDDKNELNDKKNNQQK